MTTEQPQLRPAIANFLRRYVYRRRIISFFYSVGLTVTIVGLWLFIWGIIDRLIKIPGPMRTVLLIFLAAIVTSLLWKTVIALLRRKIDWRAAAEQIEQRDPRFNQSLVTATCAAAGASPQLVELLNDQVEQLLRERSDSRMLVSVKPVYVAWIMAIGSLILLLLLCQWPWLNEPQLLRRQLKPLAAFAPVTTTKLLVAPGSTNLAAGKALTVFARDQSLTCDSMVLRVSTDGQNWSMIDMASSMDGSFAHTIAPPTHDIIYQVIAGDTVSAPFAVHVLPRVATALPSDANALKILRGVRQQLADLPQTLADVEQAAKWTMQIQDRAKAAATPSDAATLQDQLTEAFDLVAETADPIDPDLIAQMARDVREHTQQSSLANTIDQKISPPVIALHQAIDAQDSAAILQAIADARKAIALAQNELKKAGPLETPQENADEKSLQAYFEGLQAARRP